MESKIIGKIDLDEDKLAHDLQIIDQFEFSTAYHEYSSGDWKTCMLWNQSGDKNDSISREYDGSATPTAYGSQLSYVNEVIHQLFKTQYIKSVRIFSSSNDGVILPHMDYFEFKKGFTRIHIPLQISQDALSSEENTVYSMRKGEIWYLEGRKIHSAANFGKKERYNLVLDFDPGKEFQELFSSPEVHYATGITPHIVQRAGFTEQDHQQILDLSNLINRFNFNDVLGILGKVHFYKQVSSMSMFDWLMEIAHASADPEVIRKAEISTSILIHKGPALLSEAIDTN